MRYYRFALFTQVFVPALFLIAADLAVAQDEGAIEEIIVT